MRRRAENRANKAWSVSGRAELPQLNATSFRFHLRGAVVRIDVPGLRPPPFTGGYVILLVTGSSGCGLGWVVSD